MRRLVLIGAESTGKSSLAQALGDELGWPVVGESARALVDRLARPLSAYDLTRIVAMHRHAVRVAELEAKASGLPWVILDTDLFATQVYSNHYLGVAPDWLLALARRRRGHLYVLCPADFPFEAEAGQRGTIGDQRAVQEQMERLWVAERLPVLRVKGPVEERVGQVVAELGGLL